MLLLLLLACHPDPTKVPSESGDSAQPTAPTWADVATREDGWLIGDLHTHSQYSDGLDDVATLVALAEALEDPAFLSAHPEYQGHGLDFLAITDHSSTESGLDPGFLSDRLALLPGAEWTFPGEANTIGSTDTVNTGDLLSAVDTIHAAGGIFSINHPMAANYPFANDLRFHDSVEVWNTAWALSVPPADESTRKEWESTWGPVSPFFSRALQAHSRHAGGEALVLYEAMESRGVHVAMVGGSDRHAIFLPGFPTTWVHVDPPGSGADEILSAIQARHTFVSRTPAGPQVLLGVTDAEAGDEFPVGAKAVEVELTIRTARAPSGVLEIVMGEAVASDEALETASLGQVAATFDLSPDGLDEVWNLALHVGPGDWVYAVVHEPLVLDEEDHDFLWDLARQAAAGSTDPTDVALTLAPFMDLSILGDPSACDPAEWDPDAFQCMPADLASPASFFVPDKLNRALNAETMDGEPTGRTMGAVTSALRFVE